MKSEELIKREKVMITKSRIRKFLGSLLLTAGIIAAGGYFTEVSAQRDPFAKPVIKPKPIAKVGGAGTLGAPKVAGELNVPPVEQRVNYYMNVIRPQCIAQNCAQMPKPTVVMTLAEMQVTGITRTPRGYAAIVELTPIKLSYTIYPGEKFFDGQLVAVEDNQLVFRRVTKMSNGKFNIAEEKKVLRQRTFQEELARSTVDTLPTSGSTETEKQAQGKQIDLAANKDGAEAKPAADPNKIEFPMDELTKSEKGAPKDAKGKPAEKGKGKPKAVVSKKN
jgi:hypothetical protein